MNDESGKSVPLWARELLRLGEVAALLGVSRGKVAEWRDRDLMPQPVEIDGAKRYRTREVRDWVTSGMPERSRWTWRPTLPQRLDDLIRERTNELTDVQRQLTAANLALADAAARMERAGVTL